MKKTIFFIMMILAMLLSTTIAVYIPRAAATTPSVLTSSPSATTPASGGWLFATNAFSDSTGTLGNGNSAGTNVVGSQQTYYGYGISIPTSASISSVIIRIDAASSTSSSIKIEVSADGGATYLATFDSKTISTTSVGSTFYTDITSWTTWTNTNLNQIRVRVTLDSAGLVWLDWIPVDVTYSSTTNSPSLTDPASEGWGNPTGAYADDSIISAALSAYSVTGTAFAPQKYHGYGFAIPTNGVIISVRVRLDAASVQTSAIKLEVSVDGGATFLAPPATAEIITSGLTGSTYWVDITSWNTWTPSNLNNDQIWVKVTRSGIGNTVYLDWIPIEVTYVNGPQNVIPEVPFGTIAALSSLVVGMVVYAKRGKLSNLKFY